MDSWILRTLMLALWMCALCPVVFGQPVIIRATTGDGGHSLTHGHLDSIVFTVDANGAEIGAIECAFETTFSNGNVIGNVYEWWSFFWSPSSAVFENRSLDGAHSNATDPDTISFSASNLSGGGWTGASYLAAIAFPPLDTGTFVIDSAALPSGARLAVYDMTGTPLAIDWQVDTFQVLPHPNDPYWHELGGGTDDSVCALVVHDGNLIAGGEFLTAGGIPANRIARWDGASWHALGSGTDGRVDALCEFNGDLIAGGTFTSAGGVPANYIARWDGAAWHALGSGLDSAVRALAVYGGELFAAGRFILNNYHIARWNGTSWDAPGNDPGVWPVALTVYDGRLIASGNPVLAWDGLSWQILSPWDDAPIDAFAEFHGDLIGGGGFVMAGETFAANIARWDGVGWHGLGGGTTGGVYCLGTYNGELIVGGDFILVGWAGGFRIVSWNGTRWQELGSGLGLSGWPRALTVYNGELIVAGNFSQAGSKPAANFAAWYVPPSDCPIVTTGDVNVDGVLNASDIIYLVNYVFKGGPAPLPCAAAGDVNCDGQVSSADIIRDVLYIFKGFDPPCDVCALIPDVWTCP
jgi:hypothetical protein